MLIFANQPIFVCFQISMSAGTGAMAVIGMPTVPTLGAATGVHVLVTTLEMVSLADSSSNWSPVVS